MGITSTSVDRKCEKDKCGKEGNYSSKIGYFCLDHILDYDLVCPNDDCPRKGHVMDKLISEIKKDINGDLHQIFLCPSCNYRHDHKVMSSPDSRSTGLKRI